MHSRLHRQRVRSRRLQRKLRGLPGRSPLFRRRQVQTRTLSAPVRRQRLRPGRLWRIVRQLQRRNLVHPGCLRRRTMPLPDYQHALSHRRDLPAHGHHGPRRALPALRPRAFPGKMEPTRRSDPVRIRKCLRGRRVLRPRSPLRRPHLRRRWVRRELRGVRRTLVLRRRKLHLPAQVRRRGVRRRRLRWKLRGVQRRPLVYRGILCRGQLPVRAAGLVLPHRRRMRPGRSRKPGQSLPGVRPAGGYLAMVTRHGHASLRLRHALLRWILLPPRTQLPRHGVRRRRLWRRLRPVRRRSLVHRTDMQRRPLPLSGTARLLRSRQSLSRRRGME